MRIVKNVLSTMGAVEIVFVLLLVVVLAALVAGF